MTRSRKSRAEIKQLIDDQAQDAARRVAWPEVIRQQVRREYDALDGSTWRQKTFELLFRLNWKERWIARAMKVSLRTVRRIKKKT